MTFFFITLENLNSNKIRYSQYEILTGRINKLIKLVLGLTVSVKSMDFPDINKV
jgi:hypothetical protein